MACESNSSSSGGTLPTPEAGAPFTPDAATTDAAPPPAPPPVKTATTTTLDLTPLQPKVGDEVTLTATVTGKTPTGTLQLKDGATDLGTPIALVAGADPTTATATLKTTTLAAGAHVVSAVYAGDDNDAASTSTTTSFTVTFPTKLPFNTGLDNARVALADLAIDTHWTVKDASGKALPAYVQTDALGFVGYWLPPSTTSKFLSPFIDTVEPTPASGPFTYTTTFSLASDVNLATTKLTVSYASDNATDSITLNGQAITGVTAGSYGAFVVLPPITAPFVVGPNTISFVSSNGGGPTGFRAELDLTTN